MQQNGRSERRRGNVEYAGTYEYVRYQVPQYRRRGSSPPLLRDPGWVVYLVVVEDGGSAGQTTEIVMAEKKKEKNITWACKRKRGTVRRPKTYMVLVRVAGSSNTNRLPTTPRVEVINRVGQGLR